MRIQPVQWLAELTRIHHNKYMFVRVFLDWVCLINVVVRDVDEYLAYYFHCDFAHFLFERNFRLTICKLLQAVN